ncbi:hypothetical protein K438DRAFT_2023095 [Mycena galopus ATCC 62051]|nr:hypothetical protein K438DRAFT_2023095 [Mycena galopus ATCC 62051]
MAPLLRYIKGSLTLPFTSKKPLDYGEKSERKQSLPQNDKKSRPLISTETRRTASHVLYFALKTLSSISNRCIEQSSVNEQGLIQLATRIERLTPIVEEMTESDPDRGQAIVLDLQTELASMATDLEEASQRGKLNQFFNSADDASALSKHNTVLTQMIADSTVGLQFIAVLFLFDFDKFVGVHEVLKTLRERESLKMQDALSPIMMGDITGNGEGRTVEFCNRDNLSKKIHQLLADEGFETTGGLFLVSEGSLKESGFKPGHIAENIAELKRALMEFSAQGGVGQSKPLVSWMEGQRVPMMAIDTAESRHAYSAVYSYSPASPRACRGEDRDIDIRNRGRGGHC